MKVGTKRFLSVVVRRFFTITRRSSCVRNSFIEETGKSLLSSLYPGEQSELFSEDYDDEVNWKSG